MKIKLRLDTMTDHEAKYVAYWERNVLALKYADGWYDDVVIGDEEGLTLISRYEGWRRVLSLEGGKITFHIPDDFDVGDLKEIDQNWDGHTTEAKWARILASRSIK